MTTASIQEVKKELRTLDPETVQELCMRLAKYKKENKELLSYLLFEAHDEPAYIESVKEEMRELFETIPDRNTYLIKKALRKILRITNKQIKYSGINQTELELRISFCTLVKDKKIPLQSSTVLSNLYRQQLLKIKAILAKLPEDLQSDYDREIAYISK